MNQLQHTNLVRHVTEAVTSVFETMLSVNVHAGKAYTNGCAAMNNNGVISFIGLAGPYAGTGSISCSAHIACRIASQFLMTEYHAVDDEVLDAVAEVTNMVIGHVKTEMEETLGAMGLSIPTVIYGRNFTSRTVGKQEWTIVPFEVEGETIEVQLCLAPSRDAVEPRVNLAGQEAAAI